MDIAFIERLIGMVEQSTLLELEFAEKDASIRLSKTSTVASSPREAAAPIVPASSATKQPQPVGLGPSMAVPVLTKAIVEHSVRAGVGGLLYRAPAPGEKPFAEVGDQIEEGQTLAIIEAMKMLNPVEADRAGRIVRILIEEGDTVETGDPLFVIGPSEVSSV